MSKNISKNLRILTGKKSVNNQFGKSGSIFKNNNTVVYDPIAQDYFTRAGITDEREKNAANTFIATCRANTNIWNAIINGAVYLVSPTNYASATHNAMSSSFQLTDGVAPSFSSANGFDFDGLTQYLRSQWIPSVNLIIGFKHTTIYSQKTAGLASNGFMWASNVSATQQFVVRPRTSGGNATLISYSTANGLAVTNANSNGTFIHNAYTSTSREILRNGVSLGTTVTTGGGTRPNIENYLGASNSAGVPSLYYACKITSLIQTDRELTQAESIILANALDTYNSTVISGGR